MSLVPAPPRSKLLPAPRRSKLLGDQLLAEDRDVGEIAVPLAEVEAVADDEPVGDLEADVAHGNVDLAPIGLRHQSTDLEHVATFDVDVEVLEDPDDAGGIGRVAVARERHEVDLAGDGEVPHQVGHEEDGTLEDADQEQV